MYLFILLLLQVGVNSLRMTQFLVPNHVIAGKDARLECNFDLEDEVLYAVKWYKDGNEFYHYQPADDPPKYSFPEFGIDVDVSNSSMTSVVLPHVPLTASGRYRCEVSGEAPAFTTISDHGDMTIIYIPEEGPHITGGKPRYQNGEWVRVNCSTAPAYPPPVLAWFVNGDSAPTADLVGPERHVHGPLVATTLGLRFKVRPRHFKKGDLKIKCLMTIGTMYSRSNEESVEAQRLQKGPALESRNAVAVVSRNNSRADRVQGISMSASTRPRAMLSFIIGACALLMR